MEEKSTKLKYRRNKKSGTSRVEALTQAQKIAFAPFSFQVVEAFVLYGGGKVCLHYAVVELVEVFEKGNETVVDDVFGCLGVLYV